MPFRVARIILLSVQPKPKLESLDDLLAQAEHYANHSIRNIGRLPPTLFLIGPDGPLMLMPESLKNVFAGTVARPLDSPKGF